MDRRSLSALTMTVLTALLVVGAVFGAKALFAPLPGSDDDETATAAPCEPDLAKGELVRAKDVTVSVYNAGDRSGLADQTRGELVARGFLPGDIGNAPASMEVRFVRILAPRKDDPAARLVALQFGRNTLVQASDLDLGPGVAVLVGDAFAGLRNAPSEIRAKAPGSGC